MSEANRSKINEVNKRGVDKTNKGRINEAKKGRINEANKKEIDKIDKDKVDERNKDKVGEINIEADKKAGIRALTSIDNSIDSDGKVINWYANFTILAFAILTAANCAGDYNFADLKKTPLDVAASTFDKFIAIFATHVNTILEK